MKKTTKATKNTTKTVEEQLAKYKRLARKRKQIIEEMEQDKADTIKALEDKHKESLDIATDVQYNDRQSHNAAMDALMRRFKYTCYGLLAVIFILTITVFFVLEKAPERSNAVSQPSASVSVNVDTIASIQAPVPAKPKHVKTATKHLVITSMAQWDSLEAAHRAKVANTKEADKREATDTASTSP